MILISLIKKNWIIVSIAFIVWLCLHIPVIFYGTQSLPLHQSYISADEQSPINGGLHILKDKNIFALRNLTTVYYGPVFSIIALPPIITDYVAKLIKGDIHSSDDYKSYILWDWGGILWKSRVIAVATGFIGLLFLYLILMTKTVNRDANRYLAFIGVLLLASNFYYFEYASLFKHWIFVVVSMLGQIYVLIRMYEEKDVPYRYYIYHLVFFITTFGISYVTALSQVMFIPLVIDWMRTKNWVQCKKFIFYILATLILIASMIAWSPRSFIRIVGLVSGDIANTDTSQFSSEIQSSGLSFSYYTDMIVRNHIPLMLLIPILSFYVYRKKMYRKRELSILIALASTFFIIFGIISHHETRYILPVIVSIIVTYSIILIDIEKDLSKSMRTIVCILLLSYVIFHAIHIVKWISIYSHGPVEENFVQDILDNERNKKVLIIDSYILGHAHTQEAYTAYMKETNKENVNLYKEILKSQIPYNTVPINVYYKTSTNVNLDQIKEYSRVVLRIKPWQENTQLDFYDQDLLRLWNYNDFSERFIELK